MQEFVGLFVFLILAFSFATTIGLIEQLRMPKDLTISKTEQFPETLTRTDIRRGSRFIVYGILFLIFTIETSLLFPCAVVCSRLGHWALITCGIFVAIMLFGLIYTLKKNVLRWK